MFFKNLNFLLSPRRVGPLTWPLETCVFGVSGPAVGSDGEGGAVRGSEGEGGEGRAHDAF